MNLKSSQDPEYVDDGDASDDDEWAGAKKIHVGGVSAKIIAERIEYIGPQGTLNAPFQLDFTPKGSMHGGQRRVQCMILKAKFQD